MRDDKPLSDNQAGDRIFVAREALGSAPGATVRADTALKAARRALDLLKLGLLMASVQNADEVPGIIPDDQAGVCEPSPRNDS